MKITSTTVLLIFLLFICTNQKVHTLEPLVILTGITYAAKATFFAFVVYDYYFHENPQKKSTSCPCCSENCSGVIEDPEIVKQKKECARYREVIKEFEQTLEQNKNTKKFYTGILAPVGYARYLWGYDERLKESNAQANEKIHFFRVLLRQNYCTNVEE